jgi:hypothetical protein
MKFKKERNYTKLVDFVMIVQTKLLNKRVVKKWLRNYQISDLENFEINLPGCLN